MRDKRVIKSAQITTSKLILLVDLIVAIILTAAVVQGAYLELDMSQTAAVAACWDGQFAVATGFYYWKAKNENRSKYAMKLVRDFAEKYGIENVIHLAEVVLKD